MLILHLVETFNNFIWLYNFIFTFIYFLIFSLTCEITEGSQYIFVYLESSIVSGKEEVLNK